MNKRIPVVIGCTSLNTREVLLKMDYAAKAGADAVLVGVPFYFKSSVPNAVQFYFDLADEHPELGIFIYHNPRNHHIHIPVPAFKELVSRPNIVGMKDSHRTPMQFMQLMDIVRGKISVMTNQNQMFPYMMMGAAGCWSINAWMGPSPVIRAYQAGREGRWDEVREICMAMARVGGKDPSLTDPVESKISINEAGLLLRRSGQAPLPGHHGRDPRRGQGHRATLAQAVRDLPVASGGRGLSAGRVRRNHRRPRISSRKVAGRGGSSSRPGRCRQGIGTGVPPGAGAGKADRRGYRNGQGRIR